jgi:outer membrane lipoprotein-sorting protein
MRRLAAAILIICAAPAAFPYTAAELAAKNVEAKGGLEKLRAISSLRLEGRISVNNGTLEFTSVTLVKPPGSIRYEAAIQGLTQVQAYDGKQAWQINPFQGRKDPERLSADDAKGMGEDAADFAGPLVDYEARGYTLDYLGTEDLDGSPALKLRVSRPNGDITFVYLDPDQFLDVRIVNRRIEHGVPHETVTDYSDYEKVGEVYLPFAQDSWTKGTTDHQITQIEKAQANTPIDDGVFRFPAAASAAPAK